MSNINFSTLEAFGKSAGLGSSGILASLNSAFGNGSGGTSLFSSLLNEVHTDTLSTTTNAANTAVSATQGGVTSSNAADPFYGFAGCGFGMERVRPEVAKFPKQQTCKRTKTTLRRAAAPALKRIQLWYRRMEIRIMRPAL